MTDMIEPTRKTQADFDHQRANGWPDFHPEDYCHRCGMPNISWHIDGDVWSAVMRPDGHEAPWKWNEIICPVCFVQLAGKFHVVLRVDPETRSGKTMLARASDYGAQWSLD
jgi:hypothetical protein